MNRTSMLRAGTALVAGCALLAACSEGPQGAPAVARPVYVTTVVTGAATRTRSFTATVRARIETDLGFRAGGKVQERLVDVGAAVHAGEALARLEAVDFHLAVNAAADQVRAALVDADQAASDEARFRRLLADGSVGSADHERQKARADAAAARLDQARRQLELARNRESYTTLVAPYDGVVTGLHFERGQVVAEGLPVMSLARDGEREIVADIPEELIGQVRSLTPTMSAWSDPQTVLRLSLREVSPLATAQGRTFRVRYAAAPGSRAQLNALPLGSTAQLILAATAATPTVATLPVTALVKASGPAGVWAIDEKGSGLVFVPVKVVAVDDATVQVTGLAAGARVVSVGAQKLDAGMAVRAVERNADMAPSAVARSGA